MNLPPDPDHPLPELPEYEPMAELVDIGHDPLDLALELIRTIALVAIAIALIVIA